MKAYIYELSSTKNGKVNYDKLKIELATSIVPSNDVEGIRGKIFVFCDTDLNETLVSQLDLIISNHDGESPKAFDKSLVNKRENVILQLNQMGIYHPLIDNDILVEYLTSIDNYINAFVRSANPSTILKKIYYDTGVTDINGTIAMQEDGVTPVDVNLLKYHNFLNTVSNPLTGTKVFQFFASEIMKASNF